MGTSMSTLENENCITTTTHECNKNKQKMLTTFWECGNCMKHSKSPRSITRTNTTEIPDDENDKNNNNNNNNNNTNDVDDADRWFNNILPKDNFDMNEAHSIEPPYLGYSYWQIEDEDGNAASSLSFSQETPPRLRALGDDSITTAVRSSSSDLTDPNTTNENDNDGESGGVSEVMVSFTPKRLFADDISVTSSMEEEDEEDVWLNPPSPTRLSTEPKTKKSFTSQLCGRQGSSSPRRYDKTTSTFFCDDASVVIRNGVLVRGEMGKILGNSSHSHISLNTLDIPDGLVKRKRGHYQKRKRHINTLPSFRKGYPIRLQLKESYVCANNEHVSSFDPFFSMGQFTISHQNNIGLLEQSPKSYGNGLHVKICSDYMTLQDMYQNIVAITRSRYTFLPSHIIYSPRPRYEGQLPSTHHPNGVYQDQQEQLFYPWALVQKKGRRMDHEVNIHFVSSPDNNSKKIDGIFDAQPAHTAKHGFDGNRHHTHTVVLRNHSSSSTPCSIMFRSPIQRDLYDITIAPGIDPLLMICYFAIHSKMDVEPILSDI